MLGDKPYTAVLHSKKLRDLCSQKTSKIDGVGNAVKKVECWTVRTFALLRAHLRYGEYFPEVTRAWEVLEPSERDSLGTELYERVKREEKVEAAAKKKQQTEAKNLSSLLQFSCSCGARREVYRINSRWETTRCACESAWRPC